MSLSDAQGPLQNLLRTHGGANVCRVCDQRGERDQGHVRVVRRAEYLQQRGKLACARVFQAPNEPCLAETGTRAKLDELTLPDLEAMADPCEPRRPPRSSCKATSRHTRRCEGRYLRVTKAGHPATLVSHWTRDVGALFRDDPRKQSRLARKLPMGRDY